MLAATTVELALIAAITVVASIIVVKFNIVAPPAVAPQCLEGKKIFCSLKAFEKSETQFATVGSLRKQNVEDFYPTRSKTADLTDRFADETKPTRWVNELILAA